VILIIEDKPKDLVLVRDLLKVSGYKAIKAADGKQGVKLARSKKPDFILMDILMRLWMASRLPESLRRMPLPGTSLF